MAPPDEPNLAHILVAVTRVETVVQERRDAVNQLREEFKQFREDTNTQIEAMKASTGSLAKDVRDVRDTMLYTKGAWKVLLGFGALCLTIGGLIVKIPWDKVSALWSK